MHVNQIVIHGLTLLGPCIWCSLRCTNINLWFLVCFPVFYSCITIYFFRSHWVLVVLTENVVVVMDSLLKTLPDSDRTKIDRLVGEMLRVMT